MTQLTADNFTYSYLCFGDRQAGVSMVYSPTSERYTYNAYCIEAQLLKELFSVEYDFLDDALTVINEEFAQWELKTHETKKSGCGDCVAKKTC